MIRFMNREAASDASPAGDPRKVVAVVLAGGDARDPLAQEAGVAAKALVPVGGRLLVEYVIAALRGSGEIDGIIYVGPLDARLHGLVDHVVPAGKSLAGSMALGFGAALAMRPGARVLVTTADLPWLQAAALDRFIRSASAADVQLSYPIVPAATALAEFPEQKRTFVKLRDGRFTGGNQMLIGAEVIPAFLELIDRIYTARKNPFALSALLGVDVLVSLLLGRASLKQLEARAADRLGAAVSAVISPDACLAADVDRPEQLPATLPEAEQLGAELPEPELLHQAGGAASGR
jgi:molybdopterin-guanine dinucleotide biosynthesis protein A